MRKRSVIMWLFTFLFALGLTMETPVFAAEITNEQMQNIEVITQEMDSVVETDEEGAVEEEIVFVESDTKMEEYTDIKNAYYYDTILLNTDYEFVGTTHTIGEQLEIHFLLFSYGQYSNQKYYVNVYNASNQVVASKEGYFPSSLKQTNLTLTWTPRCAPGTYYVEFYSTYVTDYKGYGFPFYLEANKGEHFTCVENGTQTAKSDNLKKPLSGWKKTKATHQRYSFRDKINYQIQLVEMYVGETANLIVEDDNRFNDDPTSSQQWILMKYWIQNDGNSMLEATDVLGEDYFFTSKGANMQVVDTATLGGERKGMGIYDVDFYPGSDGYVWIGILVPKANGYPYLQISNGYDEANRTAKYSWLALDPSTYKITYKNLGSGADNSKNPKTYKPLSGATLSNPTRKGYTFKGWYSDSNYKKKITKIAAGSTGNKTVYAKWSANKYTIKFDGNKATSGKMSAMTATYDKKSTLTANAYKRTGYTFTGWNTKADGSGKTYKNKESVSNLTSKNSGTITLYAQWSKTKYSITYVLNDGKNNSNNPSSYYITSSTITLKNPSRTGYTFKGWYSDSKYKTKVTTIKKGSTGNKKLYARWSENTYNIKFDGNKATSGKMSTLTSKKYSSSCTLTSNAFKRTGYTFTGWNTKADGSGKDYANKASVKKLASKNGATVTLYAQWEKIQYTITYNLNGGKNHSSNPSKYYVTSSTITLKNPTRTGYTFKGWYSDSKYKTKVTTIKKGSTGSKKLYAKWEKAKYTITYELNGGKNNSKNPSSYDVATSTFELKAPTRSGYVFEGWYKDADFTKKVEEVKKGSVGNLKLYAKWGLKKYIVRFDANGANEGSMESMTCQFGTKYQLSKNVFTRDGYIFSGWNTKEDGTGARFADGAEINNLTTENGKIITMYAQWTPIEYTVSFDGNGATTGAMDKMTYTYDEGYTLPQNVFENVGWKFNGWNTAADGSGESFADMEEVSNLSAIADDIVILYAQWVLDF